MESSKSNQPFALLGERLKRIREVHHESLAEVSGAVEIDMDMLEQIERGELRPSEDILTLLINHFSLQESEAVQLWESAGFTRDGDQHFDMQDMANRATLVLVALDARVQYSDSVNIKIDDNGVVLNFMQAGLQGNMVPAARVGMSHEHAARFMRVLEEVLLRYKYQPRHKLLPPGDKS